MNKIFMIYISLLKYDAIENNILDFPVLGGLCNKITFLYGIP
jgi:hypothetical protein